MKTKVGDKCPIFKLKNQEGIEINISDYISKKAMIIYFYPKDNTSVCTAEACEFRDAISDFAQLDAEIFGISSDSVKSHKNFALKNKLNFNILSDENNSVRKLFGVKANLFGLIQGRETYVIDKNGIIVGIFNKLSASTAHVEYAKRILQKLAIEN
jgi:thioredoxin-dependent peroxiredoxin